MKWMYWTDLKKGTAAWAFFIFLLPASDSFLYEYWVWACVCSFADYWRTKKIIFFLRFYVNHENDTKAWEKYPSGTFDNTVFQSSISNKILLTNGRRYWCNQLVILLEGMEKTIFPSYSTVVTFFSYLNSLFWKSIGIILFWHVLRKHCASGIKRLILQPILTKVILKS